MKRTFKPVVVSLFVAIALTGLDRSTVAQSPAAIAKAAAAAQLMDKVLAKGEVNVIVGLSTSFLPEKALNRAAIAAQRSGIANATRRHTGPESPSNNFLRRSDSCRRITQVSPSSARLCGPDRALSTTDRRRPMAATWEFRVRERGAWRGSAAVYSAKFTAGGI